MTPGARVAAAIEILDAIGEGQPAEKALSRWARASRFAGSKDRAAVRDHVFDVLRNWRSDAARGGAETGRGRMIGRLRDQCIDPDQLLNGQGHAPAPLSDLEREDSDQVMPRGVAWDLPDWLMPIFEASLCEDAERSAHALKERAPVTLRANISKTTVPDAQKALERDGVVTMINPRAETALTVVDGARRVRNATAYHDGLVDIQDGSSQAAVAGLGVPGRALDMCAGGGGKALAMAALGWNVTASDIDAARMIDLPTRAARGGHDIMICSPERLVSHGPFDLVFVDAPCSGSGTWRRTPEAKWALTRDRLEELMRIQRQVLTQAATLVVPGGTLVYATCSVLREENEEQVQNFTAEAFGFQAGATQRWAVDDWGDGFFSAHLTRTG
ncbi:SAM-dependent methyltransferase [Tateyamaria omphalii]|uniref:RsmB/NOP family class I SAM-dependent RNA methyltransferase n=1 Tax=Tateyamaria omphalii TaxID=299262 RepID=UPI0016738961|nr:RsmB/NOP family class I SAM-dependent RNA methyltransferase [Tateyamaria omphalii]GGX62651.1 SAM-dependent methyltransferase [Tateyamaria omphalii]